jgi:hypothetical protein
VGGEESLLQREEQVLARNLDGEAALGKYKYLCPPPTVFNPFLNVAEVRLAKLQKGSGSSVAGECLCSIVVIKKGANLKSKVFYLWVLRK